jgi:predicted aldo/keto reductase-like oxidoreductase
MEGTMKRRDFIKTGLAGSAALSVSTGTGGCAQAFPRRPLGRTGENLSIVGLGGIVVMDEEQAAADRIVAEAVDRGVNYFDVAPSYGNAQDRLGPALRPYRQGRFLACKTTERSRAGAEKDLNGSLAKMQTDHFDLYQLHALTTPEDVDLAFGSDGAMEAVLAARKAGKTRFIGFSAHSEPAALEAMDRFDFDTILFPVNFACWFAGRFGPRVIARARDKGMGILALKAFAGGPVPEGSEKPYPKCWYAPIDDPALAELALRFTLSQGVTAAVPPGDVKFFRQALDFAGRMRPINEDELNLLRKKAEGAEPLFRSV